jgi:hypothetical protein
MPATAPEVADPPQLADGDVLIGGQQITDFVNQVLNTDYDKQTVYGWLLQGKLPYGKFGSRTMGSKRAIREALARAAARAAGLTS